MAAIKILFTTDVGLMSLGVIAFIVGMGIFFTRLFRKKMREDAARAQAAGQITGR